MAGYTDLPFRRLCRRMGAGAVYTELVSVDGLVRNSPSTWHLLQTDPAERPVAAHLYGHDPAVFAEAAVRVAKRGGFDWIDINAGCPMPKVVRRGAGAGLMLTLDRLAAIVRAILDAVPMAVTIKTRIGPCPDRVVIFDLAAAVEEAGASALAIHARSTSRRHGGPADWDLIAEVKGRCRRMAVIGNGGIQTAEQAADHLRRYGVDGVMIGRAALGRPWLFEQANAAAAGVALPADPDDASVRQMILDHLRELIGVERRHPVAGRRRHDPERVAAGRMRAHLVRYAAGRPGASEMKRQLNSVRTAADIERVLAFVFG